MKFYNVLRMNLLAISLASLCSVAETGSTNIGGAGGGNIQSQQDRYADVDPIPVTQWCGTRLSMINDILWEAAFAKSQGGQTDEPNAAIKESLAVLESGLDSLKQGFEGMSSAYSLTYRSILRGIKLAQALREKLSDSEADLRTRIFILEKYYGFIAKVSRDIDIPKIIPFFNRGCANRDGGNSCAPAAALDNMLTEENFSPLLAQYAEMQLSLVLDGLTNKDSFGEVTPRGAGGSPDAFLVSLELVAHDVVLDLNGTLVSAKLSCAIEALNGIARRLRAFNTGDTSAYRGKGVVAFLREYQLGRMVISELQAAMRDFSHYTCGQYIGNENSVITPRRDSDSNRRGDGVITPR